MGSAEAAHGRAAGAVLLPLSARIVNRALWSSRRRGVLTRD
ncbi:hypothetical protein [Micromonospora humi]|uniref:Uncharacterized protein n=1 Tax=Micromonospora humi TaxID=745366 RepID=A0A1C5GJX2_9ACTN|nr:hypothetical protein [Micromonospora humi]SCG34059.1 hypothetical protein GA0070213_101137 [Micromonospora humi]